MKLTKQVKKLIYLIIGSISLVLGLIGILFPVLPTTPFLLLSAFCFVRSSQKCYDWLINHKILGPYVKDYMRHHAVKKQAKIMALVMIWTSIPACIILFIDFVPAKFMLLIIASIVSFYILSLKTYRPEMDETTSSHTPCHSQQ